MDGLYEHRCERCGGFTNSAEHSITFDQEVLSKGLRDIYDGLDVKHRIQKDLFLETLRIFNRAAAEGISEAYDETAITDEFLEQIRHNNEVFSAFRTHRMQNDIAGKLIDEKGVLKPFERFRRDVAPLTGRYCRQWLQTEYNTAIIRAHRAADWKHFEKEKDIYPNLRWMPTTSATPDPVHERFWSQKLTLPVNDPFWGNHHPGERWGCKCTCEQTDEPVNDLPAKDLGLDTASKGLHGNPAETGKLFSEDHPYYAKNCAACPFNNGTRNRLRVLMNAEKDCAACQACAKAIQDARAQNGGPNEYYTEPKFGERLKICKGADQAELAENKRCLESLLSSFPDMNAVIRKHVLEPGVKNPEYLINGLLADRKGIMTFDGITAAFKSASKQRCSAIVIDLDMNMFDVVLQPRKIYSKLRNRLKADFNKDSISECYFVYHGKAIKITPSQNEEQILDAIKRIKPE